MPSIIKKDKILLIAYLGGFFDTDGCLSNVEKGSKSLYFVFSQSDKKIVFEVYNCLKYLGLEINKPKSFKSQSAPYIGDKRLVQWRIYIGSKKTLKKFLSIIKFRHPQKKIRAEIMHKILGPWSSSYDTTLTN